MGALGLAACFKRAPRRQPDQRMQGCRSEGNQVHSGTAAAKIGSGGLLAEGNRSARSQEAGLGLVARLEGGQMVFGEVGLSATRSVAGRGAGGSPASAAIAARHGYKARLGS